MDKQEELCVSKGMIISLVRDAINNLLAFDNAQAQFNVVKISASLITAAIANATEEEVFNKLKDNGILSNHDIHEIYEDTINPVSKLLEKTRNNPSVRAKLMLLAVMRKMGITTDED